MYLETINTVDCFKNKCLFYPFNSNFVSLIWGTPFLKFWKYPFWKQKLGELWTVGPVSRNASQFQYLVIKSESKYKSLQWRIIDSEIHCSHLFLVSWLWILTTKIEDQGMDLPVVYQNEENLYIVFFCNDHFEVWRV
jgi:hypothetical protein